MDLIIKFVILTVAVSGIIIFFLHRALISSTEGAVKRLDEETAEANKKQAELNRKIREADEELKKRKAEAKELENKLRTEVELEAKEEGAKLVKAARDEGEEIIEKAKGAAAKMKVEIEKDLDIKAVSYGIQMLTAVLSATGQSALNTTLIAEFIEKMKELDMSAIDASITQVDIITLNSLSDEESKQLQTILKEKMQRDITLNVLTDDKIGGGVILKFGTMALDDSIYNRLKEAAKGIRESIEERT